VSRVADIEQLYRLPLDEFTAARNALAKTAGAEAARVRALPKPAVPAWAVNQLYWRHRAAWDALVASAEAARKTHKAVLSGRSGDIRSVTKVHDEAVETALKETLKIVAAAGHPATDATRQALVTTLRALPGTDPPGRLSRPLQPSGFEALAGLSIAAGHAGAPPRTKPVAAPLPPTPHAGTKVDARALTKARTAAASAERELRDAEQAVRRLEFDIAKATREEQRATGVVEQAREALERARNTLEAAEKDLKTTRARREDAERRIRDSHQRVEDARKHSQAATEALARFEAH
jgi:hypothetical protein